MAWSKSSDMNVFDHLHGIFVIFIKEDNKMTLLCPKSRFIISTQTMPKKSFLMDIILYYLYLYLFGAFVYLHRCISGSGTKYGREPSELAKLVKVGTALTSTRQDYFIHSGANPFSKRVGENT